MLTAYISDVKKTLHIYFYTILYLCYIYFCHALAQLAAVSADANTFEYHYFIALSLILLIA